MSLTLFPFRPDSELPAVPTPVLPLEPMQAPLRNVGAEPTQLADIFRAAFARWRLVSLAALAGGLAGLLLGCFQTPQYRAKTSLEIQPINGDFLNMKQARPMSEDAQGTDVLMDLQTQIEILQSKQLGQNTAGALQRLGRPQAQTSTPVGPAVNWSPQPSIWRRLLHKTNPSSPVDEALFEAVSDSRKARIVGQTRILEVEVEAPNSKLAADYANMLVAEYVRQNIKARFQMTEAAEDLTRAQLADMRTKLQSSEQEMQRYAADHGLVFTSERQNISDDRIRQVQSDLLKARADLADKQARKSLSSSSQADTLPDVITDTDLRELRTRLIDLRRQEAELLTIFKPDYSDVKKVRAQADEVEAAMDRERSRVVSRIVNEYAESSQREKLLQKAYDEAVQRAAGESQIAVQYDMLKRDVDANLNAYQQMLARVKELSLAAAIRTSNVRVLDPAEAPEKPALPKLPLNVAFGMFTGMALALGYVLLHERANENLRHPGEAMMRLGVPELGVIPSTGEAVLRTDPLRFYKAPAVLGEGVTPVSADHYSQSPTVDGFRTVLTSILFSGDAGHQPKVIVVTSSSPQDGKTTVASNLAIALARTGKRVLLIDGDLRRPRIHSLFEVSNTTGFGNLLQDTTSVSESQQAVRSTSVPHLSVLPSGSFTSAPADLLFDPHLQTLLRGYRERYEMVVIDSPPMMRIPDARLLGRHADGVILVARANRTPRSSIVMACQRLGQDRSRVLGVVLNDWGGAISPYASYHNN